jgi:hypothetical protein
MTPQILPPSPSTPMMGAPAILRPGSLATPGQAQSQFLDQNATQGRLPSPKRLLEIIRPNLAHLLTTEVRGTTDIEKIWQTAQIRRANLYYRGKQYLTLTRPAAGTGYVDYQPVQGQTNLGLVDRSNQTYYDAVLNFYRGDIRAWDAVLGARSPNVQAMQSDPDSDEQNRRKRLADRVAQYLRGHWDMDTFHREAVHGLAVQGTQFSHVRYVSNAALYGYTSIPRYEECPIPGGESYFVCYGCGSETPESLAYSLATPDLPGAPRCRQCTRPLDPMSLQSPEPIMGIRQTSPITYPNGSVEVTLCGGDRITIPFWVKELKQTPWLMREDEEDRGALCQAYPDLRDRLKKEYYPTPASSSNTEQVMRYTRDMLSSPTGTAISRRQVRWTHTQVYYQPWVYEYLPNDESGALREILYQLFPDGLRTQYCNGDPFRLSNARLTREWAACKPEPGETLVGDPYFEDYIQASDTVNDFVNILLESGQRSIPLIIFDPEILDPQRIKEYANLPGEFLPARSAPGADLSKAFFRAQAATIEPALVDFIDKFMMWVRDISGITPTLWGGGGPEPTARAAEIKKNAALGRLNIPWNYLRRFEEETYENGAYQLAKWSDGRLFTSRSNSPDAVSMIQIDGIHELSQGGWYYRAEEAMPMTPGQRRDWYMNLFQMATANPIALEISGLMDPANRQRFQETVGSADWRTPGLKERDTVMLWLSILATMPPLPPAPMTLGPSNSSGAPADPAMDPSMDPSMDPAAGGMDSAAPPPVPMGPPQPSTPYPVDELFLIVDPQMVIMVTREFLTSDRGRELQESSQLDPSGGGWANILAFLRIAMMAAAPPPMPEEEGEEGGGPNGPGPKGESEGPPSDQPAGASLSRPKTADQRSSQETSPKPLKPLPA